MQPYHTINPLFIFKNIRLVNLEIIMNEIEFLANSWLSVESGLIIGAGHVARFRSNGVAVNTKLRAKEFAFNVFCSLRGSPN